MLQVKDAMTAEITTLRPNATAAEGRKILDQEAIRHLPIIEDKRLVGIVSDRDLRDASPSEGTDEDRMAALEKVRLGDIMTEELTTVGPRDLVEYAARLMAEEKIDSLPVVEGKEFVGIVTTTDMLRTLVGFSGGWKEFGSWVEINLPSRQPAILHELFGVLKDQQVEIVGFFTTAQWSPEGCQIGKWKPDVSNVIFRLESVDPRGIVRKLEEADYKVGTILVATPESPAPTELER